MRNGSRDLTGQPESVPESPPVHALAFSIGQDVLLYRDLTLTEMERSESLIPGYKVSFRLACVKLRDPISGK
jgi:hypothetical protein